MSKQDSKIFKQPLTTKPRRTKTPARVGKAKLDPSTVSALCKEHFNLLTLVEFKEPLPPFKGHSAPTILRIPRDSETLPTKSSQLFSTVLMNMFKQHEYSFSLATVLNMSSSGAGIVNSLINVNTLASNAEFASLSAVFNEFFVTKMRVVWCPVGRYNGPLGYVSGTNVNSLPIGVASLQHGATAYTSLGSMAENYMYAHSSTSDPFEYTWKNVEDIKSTVLPVLVTSTTTQSWALVSNIGSYTGSIQFLSQSAPPALPVSAVLGTFAVEYDVHFRIRE